MRRLDIRHLKHSESIARRRRSRVRALYHSKRLRQQSRPVRQPGNHSILRNIIRGHDMQALRRRCLFQAILLRIRGKR